VVPETTGATLIRMSGQVYNAQICLKSKMLLPLATKCNYWYFTNAKIL